MSIPEAVHPTDFAALDAWIEEHERDACGKAYPWREDKDDRIVLHQGRCTKPKGPHRVCGPDPAFVTLKEIARCAKILDAERVTALRRVEDLRTAAAALLACAMSADETRLCMVVMNGPAMSDPKNETGRMNHERCDRIRAAADTLRNTLDPTPPPEAPSPQG